MSAPFTTLTQILGHTRITWRICYICIFLLSGSPNLERLKATPFYDAVDQEFWQGTAGWFFCSKWLRPPSCGCQLVPGLMWRVQVVSGKLEGRLSSWLGWALLPLHVVLESLHEVQGSEPRLGLDLTKYHFNLQSSHGPISRVKEADPTSWWEKCQTAWPSFTHSNGNASCTPRNSGWSC